VKQKPVILNYGGLVKALGRKPVLLSLRKDQLIGRLTDQSLHELRSFVSKGKDFWFSLPVVKSSTFEELLEEFLTSSVSCRNTVYRYGKNSDYMFLLVEKNGSAELYIDDEQMRNYLANLLDFTLMEENKDAN